MLAVEMIEAGARRFSGRVAVSVEGESLSFAAVDELSSRLANAMAGLGLAPLERVGILFGNELLTVVVDFAALKARLVRVPLNARLSAVEHASMISSAGVRQVLFSPALADRASELETLCEGVEFISIGRNHSNKVDLLAAAAAASPTRPSHDYQPDDAILALFTSGTTGTLKAALHTQASYGAIVANILANLVSPTRDDVMIHAAPLIHASGTFILPFWLRGARAHVMSGFDPQSYLQACATERVTHASVVPTMVQMLLATAFPHSLDLALRSVIYGASPMPGATIAEAIEAFGPIFTQYYGQTEAPLAISVLPADEHAVGSDLISSAGAVSVDARVSILNKDLAVCGVGEIGEVTVEAPFVMAGYLDAEALNRETFLAPKRIRTRDMGYFDDMGYLHLVDRASDMIITGGYNVYPREVEEVLLSHPGVAECGVVGRSDATWVEAVVAFVTPKPGVSLDAGELRDFARTRLAGYKVPKEVILTGTLPKSAVGKVLRRALKERL